MRLSRKITAEFIGVFFIGTLVGGLVVWNLVDTKLASFMTRTNDPNTVIVSQINRTYVKDYHLTPEEIARIQPLVEGLAQHISQTRRRFGVDILEAFSEYHEKISDQLTPEHRAAYQKVTKVRQTQLATMLLLDQSPPAPLPAQEKK